MKLKSRIVRRVQRAALALPYVYAIASGAGRGRGSALPDAETAKRTVGELSLARSLPRLDVRRNWPEVPSRDVSVIVPCYNVERYLAECMKSVSGQVTDRSFEVIAVDDGSTDSTGAMLDGWATSDGRVRVVHQKNRGLSAARNSGLDLARGQGIVFVDSDDALEPDAIEVLASALWSTGAGYVTADYRSISEGGRMLRRHEGGRQHGAPWGRIYSRRIWADLEFPVGFWFEDTVQAYCINPRYSEHYLDAELYRYRKHGQSITAAAPGSKRSVDTVLVVECLLGWCESLGIPRGQALYDQTVKQFGPLALSRLQALDEDELKAVFVYSCGIMASCEGFASLRTTLPGRWTDVDAALRSQDYALWKAACRSL